ncbi:nickel transporter [Streptomyces sp. NPDC048566]|uniref:nickel transporter n=1 Tax=Streptomyces sp. NPDC048566 TaxID=3365569 RepID=UPI00371F6B24
MRALRPVAACGATLAAVGALVLLPAGSAGAHPLGNFTVNRYDGLVVAPGELRVDHVEDLAEIPATQARPEIERLGRAEWARLRCASAARGSRVTVDGRPVALAAGASRAAARPGQAGLDTVRVVCRLTAALPAGERGTVAVEFRGAGADRGPGWREITARADRMTLTASDVPRSSVSGELTRYPQALLSSPADTATATLRVRSGGPALREEGRPAPAASVLPRGADRWTQALSDLVARHDLTVGFAALALLIAVGLGGLHALAPGHGKTLMAATAAARGGRARLKDVLPLAASVTVTHTLGVVALGLLVAAGSAAAPSVIGWLGVASGVLVTGAGIALLRRARRHRPAGDTRSGTAPDDHGHPHTHTHPHHPHPHPHPGDAAHAHHHPQVGEHDHGPVPGPGPGPGHDHDLDHDHGHARPRPGGPAPAQRRAYEHAVVLARIGTAPDTRAPVAPDSPALRGAADPDHRRPGGGSARSGLSGSAAVHRSPGRAAPVLEHTHGGRPHTHEIAPTLRGTILLGFAGGLVPSPSAVVVLVGAAALGQAWFGLLLVLAYGVGLALTLTAAGFAVVRLGSGVNRALAARPSWAGSRPVRLVRRAAPLGSAVVVVALGAGLVLKGAASVLG